ncbi:DNA cytosine methyltransferase [Sanguibacter antarcticus]|uniref:DNA cytosine methyltransferase n=1 Tax=Sanguibacter antarcticus TaxID=372484 RepID=UPI001FEA120A|nr:DNA cytosine methyltransferase [Sanguibacter antarcticus]
MSTHDVPRVRRSRAAIRTLDLFAGAGGLTTGLRTASKRFRPVTAVEWDVAAAGTYALNHGGALVEGALSSDIVYAGGIADWLELGEVPSVDLVVGGPPCQGFSTLGKRDVDDARNLMWHEYAKTVNKAEPKYFVLENVPAFLKSPQYEVFLSELEPGGLLEDYSFEARVLNSADYGAAQARKRVVVMGHHKDVIAPGFPEMTHAEHRTVGDALSGVPAEVTATGLAGEVVTFAGRELRGPYSSRELHVGRNYEQISRDRFPHIKYGGNRFNLPDHLKSPCWLKHTSGSGDVMGRLRWEKPSVTIRTEFFKPEKGRYLHPEEHRVITHYEAALIQGFPSDYQWLGSWADIARQIGNAVPIALGAAIGRRLKNALDSTNEAPSEADAPAPVLQ